MIELSKVIEEIVKIKRERAVLASAQISPALKSKLDAELDRRLNALEAHAETSGGTGEVSPPPSLPNPSSAPLEAPEKASAAPSRAKG